MSKTIDRGQVSRLVRRKRPLPVHIESACPSTPSPGPAMDLAWEAGASTALVELLHEVLASANEASACDRIVRRLAAFLKAEKTAVGICRDGEVCRLAAVSDAPARRISGDEPLEAAMQETLLRGTASVWPPEESTGREALLVHRQLSEANGGAAIVSMPLEQSDPPFRGVLLAQFSTKESALAGQRFMTAAAAPLAAALFSVQRAGENAFTRIRRQTLQAVSQRSGQAALVAALIAIAFLAWPAPHRVTCSCRLEPALRRYVEAPYDGVLARSPVRRGDVVSEGQLLAEMDDREFVWERSGLVADHQQAAKRRDAALADRDIPEAQMAQLEVEQLALKLQLNEHRRNRVALRSPSSGVVLENAQQDAIGAPVRQGQPIFEIAPLDRLLLEIAAPAEDLPYLQTGLEVSVVLEEGTTVTAQIDAIRPQGEVRDGSNIFIAEAFVANPDEQLRPGAVGRASVACGRKTWAWILFHRAAERIRRWWV